MKTFEMVKALTEEIVDEVMLELETDAEGAFYNEVCDHLEQDRFNWKNLSLKVIYASAEVLGYFG